MTFPLHPAKGWDLGIPTDGKDIGIRAEWNDSANATSCDSARGANRNSKFRNSEIVRMPIWYSDGQELIFSDNIGQA